MVGPPPRRRADVLLLSASLVAVSIAIVVAAVLLSRGPSDASPAARAAASELASSGAGSLSASSSASPASSQPALVTIKVEVDPSDAILELDGVRLTSSTIRVPQGDVVHKLVVRAAGRVTESRDVSARADATLTIALRRAPVRRFKGPLETSL